MKVKNEIPVVETDHITANRTVETVRLYNPETEFAQFVYVYNCEGTHWRAFGNVLDLCAFIGNGSETEMFKTESETALDNFLQNYPLTY